MKLFSCGSADRNDAYTWVSVVAAWQMCSSHSGVFCMLTR